MAKRGRKKDRKKRRRAFKKYVENRGNLTAAAEELDMHVSQISRWAKEEGWADKLSEMRQRVSEELGLDKMKDDHDIALGAEEEKRALLQARGLFIMGLEAVEEGKVQFESMNEVLRAAKDYREELRLFTGEPTERRATEHTFNLNLGDGSKIDAIRGLLEIATKAEVEEEDEVVEIESGDASD